MAEIYLDATRIPVGRLGTYVSKRALLGDDVKIMNCEKAVMTGSKEANFRKYHKRRRDIGQPTHGPFIPRMPDRFVRRIIRGMLSYKNPRGKEAFKRIMCYIGVPREYADKKIEHPPIKPFSAVKVVYIKDLCRALGGKE